MDHLKQIQRAVDFIEDHLHEALPVETVAKEAGFSMGHFQMIFRGAVGDTLKEYIRRRRMSWAIGQLTSTDRRIIDIAFDCQFESQEAFSRSFKDVYGFTPGECRKQQITSVLSLNKPRITMEYLGHLYEGMTMEPTLLMIEEKKVVGLSCQFISVLSPEKNNHLVLPKLWDEYILRSTEIKNRKGPEDLGICEALPAGATKHHGDEYLYMAATEVTDFNFVPEGMIAKTIAAGRFAKFIHKGPLDRLQHTMNFIYGSWLPKSGQTLRDAPDLELYGRKFRFGSEESELEIYIPIQ